MTQKVVQFIDTQVFGGAERCLLNLLAGLDRSRWQPVLFHHPEPGLAPLLEEAARLDVRLEAVPRLQGRRCSSLPAARIREAFDAASGAPQFLSKLRSERPAVFHAHLNWPLACKYGLALAGVARVPAVVATVQLFPELPHPRWSRVQQRLLSNVVHRYLAVSKSVALRMRRALGIPAEKIEVLHNAPALRRTSGHSAEQPFPDTASQHPIVLTVARLDDQKGHRFLLQAASQLPEARFLLAGDGPCRAALERQARTLGLDSRVRFLGYRTDIVELLGCCDVFVLPSLCEGFPLAVLEAMAAGKPVVATGIGGTDEAVIDGETGLLVPPADSNALAAAIRRVAEDGALAGRLGRAARARVEAQFTPEAMVRRTAAVYEELLSEAADAAHSYAA